MTDHHVTKGSRIRAAWFETTNASLAGMQTKVGARRIDVVGTVRHIRCDSLEAPTVWVMFIEPDDGSGEVCEKCGAREIAVEPRHVVEVIA